MHVLFQRDNSNITIMRDCSSDYKDAIYLSTYIAAALAFSVRTVNTSHPSWAAPPNPRHRDLTASPPEPESRPLDDGRGRSGLGGNRVDGEAR